jgi:hypothetical protein
MVRAGRFADRIDLRRKDGDTQTSRYPEEFARLADDFNHMAAELDEFYRELEAKVAAKSKELVRSEAPGAASATSPPASPTRSTTPSASSPATRVRAGGAEAARRQPRAGPRPKSRRPCRSSARRRSAVRRFTSKLLSLPSRATRRASR